ncbi:MAG: DUF58 domain-containing protein [Sedimentisphaerales bacterium]|nr:DUF58 domain-containing protein [Sedimentisphaerales bacterium]
MADKREYLDPIFLSKLANMELIARCAVEGFFAGLHPSPFHGFSVEYSDHRQYHEGDELKFVDWKVYGRSDKLYIKRFQQETNTVVYLLLDNSKSMTFAGNDSISKSKYGSMLAAVLSYMMIGQGDSASLVLFADKVKKRIPPSSRRTHLNVILSTLQHNQPEGQTNLADVLHALAETTKRKGLVILISDLLDDKESIFKGLSHLKFLRHDVIIFQTLDHNEINLDYDGLIQFEDLESGEKIRTFPQSFKQTYSERVTEFLDEIAKTAGRSNVDYCLLDTSEPLDRAMIAYLAKRKRMR